MDPIYPISPAQLPPSSMRTTPHVPSWTQRPRRALTSGFAALSYCAVLLVAFSGCSPTLSTEQTSNTSTTPASSTTPGTSSTTPGISFATPIVSPPATCLGCTKNGTPTPTTTLTLAGAPSVQEVAETWPLSAAGGLTQQVTTACPAGDYALGGGWSVPPQGGKVVAATVSGVFWTVTVFSFGEIAQTQPTITAYVECLSGVSGAVETLRGASVSEPPSPTPDILTSPCLPGEASVGFGFNFGSAGHDLEFAGAYPFFLAPGFTEWNFHVINHGTVAHPVTAYVVCLTSNVTVLKVPGHPAFGTVNVSIFENYPQADGGPVSGGTIGSLQQPCPSESLLAGGGFDYPSGGSGNLFQLHANSGRWLGAVYALPGSTGLSLLEEAICLNLS